MVDPLRLIHPNLEFQFMERHEAISLSAAQKTDCFFTKNVIRIDGSMVIAYARSRMDIESWSMPCQDASEMRLLALRLCEK